MHEQTDLDAIFGWRRKTNPLDKLSGSGSNIITCELEVDFTPSNVSGQSSYMQIVRMYGDNGSPNSNISRSSMTSAKSIDQVVQINVVADKIVSDKGQIRLATVSGSTLELDLAP